MPSSADPPEPSISDDPIRLSDRQPNLATVIAVAVVAYAGADILHELLGHALVGLLCGVRVLSFSTVALQTASSSKVVAASGAIANVIAGGIVLVLFRRGADFGSKRYFLWLFAIVNLLNGTGYPLFSGVLEAGDWSVVIQGLQPHWAWRIGMSGFGLAMYIAVVYRASAALASAIQNGQIDGRDTERLVVPAYFAGGLLLVAAAALNPIGPMLILTSGVAAGFGAMAGLMFVPMIVEQQVGRGDGSIRNSLSLNWGLVVLATVVALGFVFVIGRGVRLS